MEKNLSGYADRFFSTDVFYLKELNERNDGLSAG